MYDYHVFLFIIECNHAEHESGDSPETCTIQWVLARGAEPFITSTLRFRVPRTLNARSGNEAYALAVAARFCGGCRSGVLGYSNKPPFKHSSNHHAETLLVSAPTAIWWFLLST